MLPTPAVAYLSDVRAVRRAVISASHNPFADNGIKLFAPGGRKLPDDVEEAIEAEIERELGGEVGNRPRRDRGRHDPDAGGRRRAYADHLVGLFETPGVLDRPGHRPRLRQRGDERAGAGGLRPLRAHVVVGHAAPDGCNINDQCGATHPEPLAACRGGRWVRRSASRSTATATG